MDYFAKFKKRIAPPKSQPTSAMQLSKFHKCWEYIHNIFIVEDRKSNMHVHQTDIPLKLRQMVDLLVDEEARQEDNATGLCMEYFLKNGILQYLVTVTEKEDYPVGIRQESIRTVASMIDLLDDRFLVHNAIHKPTIRLLRFCVLEDDQNELYSDDLVDLMYIICSKIHGFPALLNVFFHDKVWLTTPQKSSSTTTSRSYITKQKEPAHEYEFLLFTYLLRFVHREGRSGDFARTGLLFLMEMATGQLGDFIFGSDFATIMAAGLGALYSQLPRKLIVQDEMEQIYANPTSYLLSQDTEMNRFPAGLGLEYSNSPEFKYQLDSFLKLLEFCQDVLNRCPNAEISLSLLKSIRSTFLSNILYPSIIECSDMDGSSVAVISYIDLMLQTIQQGDLSKMIVGYLMDDDIIDQEYGFNDDSSRAHFTLKDLIFSRLESKSQPTVIATLKLLKTLVTKHCHYSLKLISFYPDNNKAPIDISHHLKEVELYYSLIIAIDGENADQVLSQGYEEYLKDIETTIDNDWCYQHMKPSNDTKDIERKDMPKKLQRRRSFKYGQIIQDIQQGKDIEEEQKKKEYLKKRLIKHRIRPSDPLLQILLNLLSHFFTQSAELNLALTGVITALALCPYRSLQGWISFSQSDRTSRDDVLVLDPNGEAVVGKLRKKDTIFAKLDTNTPVDEDDENDDRSVDFGVEKGSNEKTTPTFFKSYPPFFTLLQTLTQQIEYYRSEIQFFDILLHERRSALVAGESFIDHRRLMSPSSSSTTTTTTTTTTTIKNNNNIKLNNGRRPSILRPTAEMPTPVMTPSSSISTMGNNQPPLNMNTILNNPVSPLALHVKKTSKTRIQPLFSSHFINEKEEPILNLDDEDEYTFAPKTTEPSKIKRVSNEITLSMLLNNIVILQEAIKELVALIQVRRSLGVDEIVYI